MLIAAELRPLHRPYFHAFVACIGTYCYPHIHNRRPLRFYHPHGDYTGVREEDQSRGGPFLSLFIMFVCPELLCRLLMNVNICPEFMPSDLLTELKIFKKIIILESVCHF